MYVKCRKMYAEVSWPPPWVPVDTNNPAGFPAKAWVRHKPPVASMKVLNWAHIMPYRVGNPKRNPSASVNCAIGMIGCSAFFAGAPILCNTSGGRVSGTLMNYPTDHQSHKKERYTALTEVLCFSSSFSYILLKKSCKDCFLWVCLCCSPGTNWLRHRRPSMLPSLSLRPFSQRGRTLSNIWTHRDRFHCQISVFTMENLKPNACSISPGVHQYFRVKIGLKVFERCENRSPRWVSSPIAHLPPDNPFLAVPISMSQIHTRPHLWGGLPQPCIEMEGSSQNHAHPRHNILHDSGRSRSRNHLKNWFHKQVHVGSQVQWEWWHIHDVELGGRHSCKSFRRHRRAQQ